MSDGQAPPQAMPETLEGFLASVERDVQRFHDPGPTRDAARGQRHHHAQLELQARRT